MNEQLSIPKKKRFWVSLIILLVLVCLVVVGCFVWNSYLSPRARSERETQKNYQKYLTWQENYEKAMREDVYGGKTPEETLKMFVEALRREDIEEAGRYFMVDENGDRKEELITNLRRVKDVGQLSKMVNILSKAESAGSAMEGYFGFEIRDENKNLISDINMKLNQYSQVWKIESL